MCQLLVIVLNLHPWVLVHLILSNQYPLLLYLCLWQLHLLRIPGKNNFDQEDIDLGTIVMLKCQFLLSNSHRNLETMKKIKYYALINAKVECIKYDFIWFNCLAAVTIKIHLKHWHNLPQNSGPSSLPSEHSVCPSHTQLKGMHFVYPYLHKNDEELHAGCSESRGI